VKIYNTSRGIVIERHLDLFLSPEADWDTFVNRPDLYQQVLQHIKKLKPDPSLSESIRTGLQTPIGRQEIWASGITYARSRQAYTEESKTGKDLYAQVYEAERPELFFKSLSYRTVGSGQAVKIRKDSHFNVPEAELTLFICHDGSIQGYTIGNDVSSVDIEGENPLYLAQAKSFDASTAIGPCLYVPKGQIDPNTMIQIEIINNGENIFFGEVSINRMKRKHMELVEYLFKETSFPYGVYLMTGTGIVPPDGFALKEGDEILISIDGIGTLMNYVRK
jgi:2-dehydro-3-deoxy-D-arabinonate dehydratase